MSCLPMSPPCVYISSLHLHFIRFFPSLIIFFRFAAFSDYIVYCNIFSKACTVLTPDFKVQRSTVRILITSLEIGNWSPQWTFAMEGHFLWKDLGVWPYVAPGLSTETMRVGFIACQALVDHVAENHRKGRRAINATLHNPYQVNISLLLYCRIFLRVLCFLQEPGYAHPFYTHVASFAPDTRQKVDRSRSDSRFSIVNLN